MHNSPDSSAHSVAESPNVAVIEPPIRPARHADIGTILEFGRKFFGNTLLKNVVPLDEISFVGKVADFMRDPNAAFFVLDIDGPVGVIGGMVYDTWFNAQAKAGQDLFWWIEPEHRTFPNANGMLNVLENWASYQGAQWFTLAATETMRPHLLEKWYLRRGYEPSERHFIRRL